MANLSLAMVTGVTNSMGARRRGQGAGRDKGWGCPADTKGSPGEGGQVAGVCWGAAPGTLKCTLGSLPHPCAHPSSPSPYPGRVLSPWMLAPLQAAGPRAEVVSQLLAVPGWHSTEGA